jgi:hypothetical protein
LAAVRALLVSALAAAILPTLAAAYSWPLKPFHRRHPIRGTFGDPRYHLGAESVLSSFHFGVDISARDGQAVYAVVGGYVHAYASRVTVSARSGREFGYWHVRPVVRTGRHVQAHQLIGHVIARWGHVHFSERYRGAYKDPLRKGALTPFEDRTPPVIDRVRLLDDEGGAVNRRRVSGGLSVIVDAWDAPPIPPPGPWSASRLAPAALWWTLRSSTGALVERCTVADFQAGLPSNDLYGWIYAAGTRQNKPHRRGTYLFWAAHSLDTTAFPDGLYRLTIAAEDDRGNLAARVVDLRFANGVAARGQLPRVAPR